MNQAINLAILQVINVRKTALLKHLEKVTNDKRMSKNNNSNVLQTFARIDECDQLLSLLTTKLNETAESRLREVFNLFNDYDDRDTDPGLSGSVIKRTEGTIQDALGSEKENAKNAKSYDALNNEFIRSAIDAI